MTGKPFTKEQIWYDQGCQILDQKGSVYREMGQIRDFSYQISVHYWNLYYFYIEIRSEKCPGFVLFGAKPAFPEHDSTVRTSWWLAGVCIQIYSCL